MKKAEILKEYLQKNLTAGRYNHSLLVADTSLKLAREFQVNEKKAWLAGLVHDIAREHPFKELEKICRLGDNTPEEIYDFPILLHGFAGALMLKNEWGIDDPEILEAVEYHSVGHKGMGIIARIVYVADFIEPERRHIDDVFRESLKGLTLDEMLYITLKMSLDHLEEKQKPIAQNSLELFRELEKRGITVEK